MGGWAQVESSNPIKKYLNCFKMKLNYGANKINFSKLLNCSHTHTYIHTQYYRGAVPIERAMGVNELVVLEVKMGG